MAKKAVRHRELLTAPSKWSNRAVTYVYELPSGTYAIGIFHDVNLNNKMDNNVFGIPKEQYGFSNNARAFLGPPAFEAAAFELEGETTQSIDL